MLPLLVDAWHLSLTYLIQGAFLAAFAGGCLAPISYLLDCKVLFLLPLLVNDWQLSFVYLIVRCLSCCHCWWMLGTYLLITRLQGAFLAAIAETCLATIS